MIPRVLHIHRDRALIARLKAKGLYERVDRQTDWGNPYRIRGRATRAWCVAMYARWITEQPWARTQLEQLRGKSLGCWCRSADGTLTGPCHADVLLELANR